MKIIAESAFNHNGDLKYLKELAIASKKADADYFTIQIMNPQLFCEKNYSKYNIYVENSFTNQEWINFFSYAKENNINILPCVLEESSFKLAYNFGYRFFKIHATDIVNKPFLEMLAKTVDIKILLETQVATYQDISYAISIIGDKIECLMHGFSNYPTEIEDLQLNAIEALKIDFKDYKIGFADHSLDTTEIPLMALSKGVEYFEKHITLTRNNRHFDWQVSLYPEEFSEMVTKVKHYSKALGKRIKHPVKNELYYRNIMYKKVVENGNLLRSDSGSDYLSTEIKNFSREKIGIALIARLKSQRLKKKVLLKFNNNSLIEDLYFKLKKSKNIDNVFLATSYLNEDVELFDTLRNKGANVFRGHPISVIDRMLSLAIENKWGGIFRVTGDNPFTDPGLIDEMCTLFKNNDLDYIRVNNVPFGISAELFSINYLWKLYLNMENPHNSEYLSWFIVNDKSAKKGCIDVVISDNKIPYVNLSIDYQKDYERALKLLKKINKQNFSDISLSDIFQNLDLSDVESENKKIKLPEDTNILFKDYLNLLNTLNYTLRKKINI